MEVKERLMSSERQWGNQGKFGFVPTSKEIVDLELGLIDFSEIEQNNFPFNICDLSGGNGDQLNWVKEYLANKNINTSCYYNEISEIRYKECSKKYPYMNTLNEDFFDLRIGNKENKVLNKKVFSLIRNNPPYMYIEKNGCNVRAEQEFFIKNSLHDIDGGIHIFELPIHQLLGIENLLSIITFRYKIFIAKFPEKEYERYKQVVVLCQKKEKFSRDKEFVEMIKENLRNDNIPFLDKIEGPIFKLKLSEMKKAKEINIFRQNKITDSTMRAGLDNVIDNLINAEIKKNKMVVGSNLNKPIIELLPGNISQLLASGRYDDIMGNLLIKGGANKIIETEVIEEEGKETTVETEVLKPYIEITNKNGDIIYKDF